MDFLERVSPVRIVCQSELSPLVLEGEVALQVRGGGLTQQGGSLIGGSIPNLLMLMLAGPATAFPLILFALAAKRLKFSTIGIMQYLGPTMQFLLALAFGETLTSLRLVTFSLILVAVILFSLDAYGHDRHLRRSALRPT